MIFARMLVGIALIAIAALGPRFGLQGGARSRATPAQAQPRDDRRATVLILRILAALLGLWLVFFSAVQLLHGHGRLSPAATQESLSAPRATTDSKQRLTAISLGLFLSKG